MKPPTRSPRKIGGGGGGGGTRQVSESEPLCTSDTPCPNHISSNSTASDFDHTRKAVAPAYLKNAKHLLIPAITLGIAIMLTMLTDTDPSTYRAAKAQSPTSTDTPTPTPTVVPEPTASCGSSPLNGRTQKVVDAILAAVTIAEPTITNCQDVTNAHLGNVRDNTPTSDISLDISNKNLRTLKSGDFTGLTSLGWIKLNNNQLTQLPADIFTPASALTTIHLDNNQISSLPANIFSNVANLQNLKLDDNNLTSIPENIFHSNTGLRTLDLQNNNLTSLPRNLFRDQTQTPTRYLTSLSSIDIDGNEITSLPANIFNGNMVNLINLSMSRNQITSLDANIFSGMSMLGELWINRNQITSLDANIFNGLSNLRKLELGNNQIASLSANTFNGLSSLSTLNITDNRLTSLPTPTVAQDGTVTGIFNGLTSLTQLWLQNSTAPSSTCPTAGNQISTLPPNIFNGLSSLTDLRLSCNAITALNANAFDGLSSLPKLDLSRNQIASIHEDAFDGLSSLTELDLSRNQIASIHEDTFDELSSLTELYLSRNRITSIDENLLGGLPSLERLTFTNNQITSLPSPATSNAGTTTGIFNHLSELQHLSLHGNQITTLPENLFKGLSNLQTLYVSNNPQLINPQPSYFQNQALSQLTTLYLGVFGNTATPEEFASYKAVLTELLQLSLNDYTPPTMSEEATHTPTPSLDPAPGKSPQILRIEPNIQSQILSAGSSVKLQLRIFGIQNQRNDSLADDASPAEVSFEWSSSDPAGQFTESTNHEIRRNQQPDDRTALYTASDIAGEYNITAELDRPDECAGTEEECKATFNITINPKITAPNPTQQARARESNAHQQCQLPGVPEVIADKDGNQYAVFSRSDGGQFSGEGTSIRMPPGAMRRCEYIGARIAKSTHTTLNYNPNLYKFMLAGDLYTVQTVDGQGSPISDYQLETPAQACIPLPETLRGNILDITALRVNPDDTLTALTTKILTAPNENPRVCVNLSVLQGNIIAGTKDVPALAPVLSPTPETLEPETGGTALPYASVLLIAILGIATLILGIAILLSKPKHPATH